MPEPDTLSPADVESTVNPAGQDTKLIEAKLGAVLGVAPWSALANIVNGGILAYAHRNTAESYVVAGWLAWIMAGAIVRLIVSRQYRRRAENSGYEGWRRVTIGLALVSAIGWGAAPILFLSELSPFMTLGNGSFFHDAITITFAAGMAAGALASFGPVLSAFRVYVVLALVPAAVAFTLVPTEARLLLAAALVIYLSFLLYSGRLYHGLFERALRTGFKNETLVEQLSLENRRVEVLNANLMNSHDELEQRVEDRTAELSRVVAQLTQEIADREAIERRLVQAQKMEALGKLSGGIAHDFNNLLTVVLGNIEIIDDRLADDAELKPFADRALSGAKRGAELTWRLLAFTRQQPLNPKTVSVKNLVNDMEDLFHRTLSESIDIVTESTAELWAIDADPVQLENSILNLAINARDAMPGGGSLIISTANETVERPVTLLDEEIPAGDYVTVTVGDTGTGMPPDVVERAFDPFFTTKDIDKGTGLGLSMVHGFVRQSGGYLDIESRLDRGTTITLYFPRSNGVIEAEEATVAAESPGGKETVLVVEDDPDVRVLAVNYLTELGYRVSEAPDGHTALRLLESEMEFDLLFTDVVLPGGMSGCDLAGEVAHRWPKVATLYCSGYAEEIIIGEGKIEPGTEVLTKPYNREILALQIRRILDGGNGVGARAAKA